MIYALTAFAIACLAVAVLAVWVCERLRKQRNASIREAQEWAKLYWDLRDDTPARGEDGRFIRRRK